jgi:hypothetical protein
VRSSGSTQGPSLAAGDSNALGIGGCAWAEPILHGSALAFLTLGTLFNKKANLNQTESGVGWHCWSLGENIQTTWREYVVFSFYNCRMSQAVLADGTILSLEEGETCPAIPSARLPSHATRSPGVVDQQARRALRRYWYCGAIIIPQNFCLVKREVDIKLLEKELVKCTFGY